MQPKSRARGRFQMAKQTPQTWADKETVRFSLFQCTIFVRERNDCSRETVPNPEAQTKARGG